MTGAESQGQRLLTDVDIADAIQAALAARAGLSAMMETPE